jgi:hypothetical protein
MTDTTAPSEHDATALPSPRRGSRWRWSPPRHALVAGGALAAALGLGVAAAGPAAATSAPSGNTGGVTRGRPPGGMARPTVSGKITALSGDDVTVESGSATTTTVVYSSSTVFKSAPGPSGGSNSSASALKVGEFIGVNGTKGTDGTVTASTITIGRPPQRGKGGPGSGPGGKGGTPPAGAGAPPSA